MTLAHRATRASGGFSGLGTPSIYSNDITIVDAAIQYQGRPAKPIYRSGKWLVKKFPAQIGANASILLTVSGKGGAFVSGTFMIDNKEHYLFALRAKAGRYEIKTQIPFNSLPNFRFSISNNLDSSISTQYLSTSVKNAIANEAVLTSKPNLSFQSPGLGFGFNDPTNPTKSNTMIPQTTSDQPLATEDKYWDGDLKSHSWDQHGKSLGTKGALQHPDYPRVVGDTTGYYAFTGSTYLADYDADGKFLGWNCVEKSTYDIEAGRPICVVMQCFAHESLGQKTMDLATFVAKNSPLFQGAALAKAMAPKAIGGGGLTLGQYKDKKYNEYLAALPISRWLYADGMQIQKSDLFLMTNDNMGLTYKETPNSEAIKLIKPESMGSYPHSNPADVLNMPIQTWYMIPEKFTQSNGNNVKKSTLGAKVEWWTGSGWSTPQRHPPTDAICDNMGKFKLTFRFPRASKPTEYFPRYNKETDSVEYQVLGQSPTTAGEVGSFELNDKKYFVKNKVEYGLMIRPGDHPATGIVFNKKPQGFFSTISSFNFMITDPITYAKHDLPHIGNAIYKNKSFKPGSYIVAIGEGLGQFDDIYDLAISKKRSLDIIRDLRNKGFYPDQQTRRTAGRSGELAGTTESDYITGYLRHITTEDLLDDQEIMVEQEVKDMWMETFGKPLTANTFRELATVPRANGGMGLKNQDPDNPLNYVRTVRSGTISFPYSILIMQIPDVYTGPCIDFDETGKIIPSDDPTKKYVITGPNDKIYLHMLNKLGRMCVQDFDIYEEIIVQVPIDEFKESDLVEKGETEGTTIDITEENQAQEVKDAEDAARKGNEIKFRKRGVRYTDSWWDANFKYGNKDVIKKDPTTGQVFAGALGAFTQGSDFYVEDVTEKWGSLSGGPTHSPIMSDIAGLGAAHEEELPEFSILNFFSDTTGNTAEVVGQSIGKTAGAATGEFLTELTEHTEDMSVGEKIGIVGVGLAGGGIFITLAGVTAGVAMWGAGKGIANILQGAGKGVNAVFTGG